MADLLIHIGYEKAGSTWLQDNLFDNPASDFESLASRKQYVIRITRPNELDFDPVECKRFFEDRIQEVQAKGLIPVLSSENFAGYVYSGGYDAQLHLDRLKRMFPDARILLIIREQQKMVLSTYKEFINEGGLVRPQVFFDPPFFHPYPRFNFEQFKYHRLISRYQEAFGKENVLVLPLEMLRSAPQEYISRITAFAGAKPITDLPFNKKSNASWGSATYIPKRFLNHFVIRTPLNGMSPLALQERHYKKIKPLISVLDKLIPDFLHKMADRNFKQLIREKTAGIYEESNAITSELIGLNLAEFGYAVPAGYQFTALLAKEAAACQTAAN